MVYYWTQIDGQVANDTASYCYLYEPLRVVVGEDDTTAKKIYIDINRYNAETGVLVDTLTAFGEFDNTASRHITIDLMSMVRQLNDAKVYKVSSLSDLSVGDGGYLTVITKYMYEFVLYSDITESVDGLVMKKIPIIGERNFDQFTPSVTQSSPLTEFDYYGLDLTELKAKWSGYSFAKAVLKDPTVTDIRPTVTTEITTGTNCEPAAFLIWKSRFGGWMYWGFDIKKESFEKSYVGKMGVSMFESTKEYGGNAYVPVDYAKIETFRSLSLKSLNLSKLELKALSGMHASPAVYYYNSISPEKLELMRVTSNPTPIDSLANGGDFGVSLKSISTSSELTA